MDTVPATSLLDAVGINFNVEGRQIPPTARLLANSGFSRARIELSWGNLSYDNPNQLVPQFRTGLETKLRSLSNNGLRPLIVLNSNHGNPCPTTPVSLSLMSPADVGDTWVHLDPSTIQPDEIVLGRTGIKSNRVAANHLFTSVAASGLAHLSKPLKTDLPAGPLSAVTLYYQPFGQANLPDGSPNPRFQETMDGWLSYVGVATREVKSILGSDEFDVEVWNELGFGSNFLNINNYYEPDIEPGLAETSTILRNTVEFIRNPANDLPDVEIGNGFANQSPHGKGLYGTAIDKHPYSGLYRFPRDKDRWSGVRPLNALGEPDGVRDSNNVWHDSFTPTFDAYFPEYFLSAIQPETLIRDLAPYVTSNGAEDHGRNVTFSGSSKPSPVWVTEVNLPPNEGTTPSTSMSADDVSHVEAKTILRYLVSYVSKGVKAIDFYAAKDGEFSLIEPGFFAAVKERPDLYPGNAKGGDTMTALGRLTDTLRGATTIDSPREVSLRTLTDFSSNYQFAGDGTEGHRPLYNRDVLAFFPFQVTDHRFVIPTYVMTRNITKVYDSGSTDPSRFDMPAEPFGLDIGGIDGIGAQVEALDPMTGDTTPVEVTDAGTDHIAVKMQVTDSPRLLVIRELGDIDLPELPEEPEEPGEEPETPTEPEDPSEPGEEPETPTEPGEEPESPYGPGPRGPMAPLAPEGSDEEEAGAPHITLRLDSRRTLLQRNRLTATARCDRPCRVAIRGTLKVGAQSLSMRSTAHASGLERPRVSTAINLLVNARVAKLVREALASGTPVSIIVSASATTSDGGSATTRQTLLVSSAPRKG